MHLTCTEMTEPHTTFFLAVDSAVFRAFCGQTDQLDCDPTPPSVFSNVFSFLAEWGDWWASAAIGPSSSQANYGGAGWRGRSSGGLPLAWKRLPAKPCDACGMSLFPALPGQLNETSAHMRLMCFVCVVYTCIYRCLYAHTTHLGVWAGWYGNNDNRGGLRGRWQWF